MEKIKHESLKEKNGKGGAKADETRTTAHVPLDFQEHIMRSKNASTLLES